MTSIAAIFPGQGSQRVGMAKDFYDTYPESKDIFDVASLAINVDLATICFTQNETLNLTEFTQPAILTAEIAMLNALKNRFNFTAQLFAGHSLGEYTALVAAGVLPFKDAVQIVRKRGALMQQAVPEGFGAMAALLYDNIQDISYLEIVQQAGAEVANYNSAEQIVISGQRSCVELACNNLKQQFPEMRTVMLNVSAPFHCSLMNGIEQEFSDYLCSFKHNFNLDLTPNVISNFNGGFHSSQNLIEGLVRQISGSVRWLQNMKALSSTATEIIEIGPTRVLAKFFSSIDRSVKTLCDLRSTQRYFEAGVSLKE